MINYNVGDYVLFPENKLIFLLVEKIDYGFRGELVRDYKNLIYTRNFKTVFSEEILRRLYTNIGKNIEMLDILYG